MPSCFQHTQHTLYHAPVLVLLDSDAKHCLDVDDSQNVLGAVLSQVQDNAEKVLSYFSCKLHIVEM